MSLTSPLMIILVMLGGAYVTQVYFVLPEIRNGNFDIAAAQWFVFCPLYLFVKRKWTLNHLSAAQQKIVDIVAIAVANLSLGYLAIATPKESLVRVMLVWSCCLVMSVIILRTAKTK